MLFVGCVTEAFEQVKNLSETDFILKKLEGVLSVDINTLVFYVN